MTTARWNDWWKTAISITNRLQIERALDMVLRTGKKRIGILGFSFKAGTDDS